MTRGAGARRLPRLAAASGALAVTLLGPVATAPTRADPVATQGLVVTVAQPQPAVPTADSTLFVRGTVTDTGGQRTGPLLATLQDGGQVLTRAALPAALAQPPTSAVPLAPAVALRALRAGQTESFTLTVPHLGQALAAGERVYALSVMITAAPDRTGPGGALLGATEFPLAYFPSTIRGALHTALVIPLTAPPDQGPYDRAPSGDFVASLAPDGRLGKLVAAVAAATPGGGQPATALTLAVDPALLDRVCALAGACGSNIPAGTPAAATVAAKQWFNALLQAVESPAVTVTGLPYADADLAALVQAGDQPVAIRLLTEAGDRVHHVLTAASTSEVQPLLPPDGIVGADVAKAAAAAGATIAVVSASQSPPVVTAGPPTPTSSTRLSFSNGVALPALVTDSGLQRLLDPGAGSGAPLAQEQRLIAELAVITSEQPNGQARTVVLEAPRGWNPPGDFATRLVRDLGTVPWVHAENLATVQGSPPGIRSSAALQASAPAPLTPQTIGAIDALRGEVAALRALATSPDETLSAPLSDELDRALSAWWRAPGAAGGTALVDAVNASLRAPDGGPLVKLGANPHGVLLTGASGTLPVQLSNLLPEPVAVVVRLQPDPSGQVTGRSTPTARLAAVGHPGDTVQLSLPITTRSTRKTTVLVQVLAASDPTRQIGGSYPIPVRSTAVGRVAVGITAGALTVLVLALVVRAGRRLRGRRVEPPAAADLTPVG